MTRAGSRVRSVRRHPWPCARKPPPSLVRTPACAVAGARAGGAAGRNRNKPFAVSSRGSRGFPRRRVPQLRTRAVRAGGVGQRRRGRLDGPPRASGRPWPPRCPARGARRFASPGFASPRRAAAPRDASCAFGTARDFLATRTATDAGFVSFACACAAPSPRGGFVTLRVDLAGFAVTDDVREASRARHPLVTGRGFALLAYAAPRAVAVAPRSAADRGGRWRSSAGFDSGRREPGRPGRRRGRVLLRVLRRKRERRNALRGGGGARLLDAHAVRDAPLFAPLAERLSERSGRRRDGSEEASKRVFVRRRVAARRAASVAIARGADFAPARALPSGVEITAHVAPRVAAGAPVVGAGGRRRRARRRLRRGRRRRSVVFRKRFGFFGADDVVFGAVSVRANPAADDDDIATFECATPTRARRGAVALVSGTSRSDASVEVASFRFVCRA